MLHLKLILQRLGQEQKALAAHLGLSRAAVAQWLNHDHWPRADSAALRATVGAWLTAQNALDTERATWWQALPADEAHHHLGPGRGRGRPRRGPPPAGPRPQRSYIHP